MPSEVQYAPEYYDLMKKAEETLDLARVASLEGEAPEKVDQLTKISETYRDFSAMYRHVPSHF